MKLLKERFRVHCLAILDDACDVFPVICLDVRVPRRGSNFENWWRYVRLNDEVRSAMIRPLPSALGYAPVAPDVAGDPRFEEKLPSLLRSHALNVESCTTFEDRGLDTFR